MHKKVDHWGEFKLVRHTFGLTTDFTHYMFRFHGREVHYDAFRRFIMAEHAIRQTVQRESFLKKKQRALQKVSSTPEDEEKLRQIERELQTLERRYALQDLQLWEHEVTIPSRAVSESYKNVRENPTWYLREELIRECTRRGGCCSRDCGCCRHRASATSRNRGIGHCTADCGCCASYRGFEYSEQEKKDIANQLERMLKKGSETEPPAYLIEMTEAYFAKPRCKPKSESKAKSKIAVEKPEKTSVPLWKQVFQ